MELEIANQQPKYRHIGLLAPATDESLPLDPLSGVGLGLGASPRARILVFKGLIAELEAEIWADAERPGAPRKGFSNDRRRAISVIYHVWSSPDGAYRSETQAIRDVIAEESRRIRAKQLTGRPLFQGGEDSVLPSVSRGLAAYGMNSEALIEKQWSEQIARLLDDCTLAQQLASNGGEGLSAKA